MHEHAGGGGGEGAVHTGGEVPDDLDAVCVEERGHGEEPQRGAHLREALKQAADDVRRIIVAAVRAALPLPPDRHQRLHRT